jgi:predicted Fe-Mo cluster-binding NifX family protein
MATIVLTCKGDTIVSIEEAEELVVFDIDSKSIVTRIKKPNQLELLEDMLEEYDPWAIVTSQVTDETFELLREMGLKVELVETRKLKDYLEEVFG